MRNPTLKVSAGSSIYMNAYNEQILNGELPTQQFLTCDNWDLMFCEGKC
jgi:hypothetical protein